MPASRLRRVGAATGGAVLLGAALFAGCVGWVRAPSRGRIVNEHNVRPIPVAIVLGAQVYPSGWPSAFLRARLDLGRRLYEAGRVEVLLVSGAADAPEYDEPRAMRAYLEDAGVPADRIVEDPFGLDTYDSCTRARDVYGLDRIVLVSQSYHLPRAVGTARRLGLDAYGVGDETVRGRREPWVSGSIRDRLACVKAVWDLMTGRSPVLEPAGPAELDILHRVRA